MAKKVSPASAAPTLISVLTDERAHLLMGETIAQRTARWVNARIDTFAAKHARDKSHGVALGNEIRAEIVTACAEIAARPVKDGGLTVAARKQMAALTKDWDKVEAVLGKQKRGSWESYVSGARFAFANDLRWTPSVYRDAKKAKDADPKKPGEVSKVDPKTVDPTGQPKQSTAPATNESAKTDTVNAVILAASQSADRVRELIAFARAKGWI